MGENAKRVCDLFRELSEARRAANDLEELIGQFGISFGGPQWDCVTTEEVFAAFSSSRLSGMSREEFESLIPSICDSLGLSFEKVLYRNNFRANGYRVRLL